MKQRSLATFLAFFLAGVLAYGQDESSDFLRSTGKIYVVVAVLAVIFLILMGYLIYLDRRTRKLEKKMNHGSE